MFTLWLMVAAIGLALIVALVRLGGGIAKARGLMNASKPRERFNEAVNAAMKDFSDLKPYVVGRDEGGIDVDCTDLQLRFEGTVERCAAYGRLSAYDRWMPLDRVLQDNAGALSVAGQGTRIAFHAHHLASRLLSASAEH